MGTTFSINPTLRDFSAWLSSLANAASRVATPSFLDKPLKKEGRVHIHQTAEITTTAVRCYICGGGHKIMECEIFTNEPTNQRWRIVKEKKLCRQCLGEHRRRCFSNKVCGIDGCNARHHPMLHSRIDQSTSAISSTANNVSSDIVEQISLSPYSNKALLNNHNLSVNKKNWSYCRTLPVTLYGTKRTINTYALMDDGSTLTLIEASLADELGNDGIQDALCINWTGNISRQENNSKRLNLQISANAPQAKKFPLKNVRTVSNLRMSAESFAADKIKQGYPHLDGLPLASYTNAVPMLIIGVNNPNLISALKVREGGWQEPVAVKTRLGWTVFGGGELNHRNNLNLHKCSCGQEADRELHELVKTFIVNENVAVATPKAELLSVEDQRAEEIMRKCQLRGNRYVVNLPWNTDMVDLPNSLPMALRRAECLRRKMHGDPELCQKLKEQITTLVSKGYATELPPEAINERGGKIWYLPIFIVRNLLKPKKHRLVWDAAAKAEGVSLNDFLLKGPDMLRPLINILLNFRIGRIAVCGDIAEMFHRILVQEADTDAQRFLWFSETFKNICVYKLNVVSFGARCSPYIAHFIRNLNAERFIAENPRAVYAIKNNHYVDDFIDSTNSIKQAIALAEAVRNIHEQGGFHMRSWTSNAPEVLAALNENGEQTGKSFNNNIDTLPIEKILGMYWDPKSDCFKYVLKFVRLRRNVFADEIVPTKREVLQILMSIFDPLGLAACLTSYLKILIQDIWRSGIDWDQPLVPDLMGKWLAWVACMPIFVNISVPRCYSPYITESSCDVQIHTFVDASEFAYAAVSYFRIKDKYGVSTRIVAAKTKVAPMRPMSIPKMKLQAAVIGTWLMNTICKVHTFDIKKRFIWSDRKALKRWGVIITCLTIRAVHIEIAHSLSTDSCLMCLRNFIARRGEPITIYSDNATNFHGVENVLRKELKNIDSSVMQHKLAHQGIDWKFNPPAAPHMGGAWERLIRTIKTVLYQISPSQRFTDESLRTALLEVEMIINSRPLTYVSLDSEDEDPITPNHFLLGSANGLKPFCDAKRIDPKMCLLQSEMFANQFWRRWVREILSTLTRRGKWCMQYEPP
ncbi:uncharacterized protein LOC119666509 [Teleopsis dalmanni]|uniref:uncharacterized protein LOC119666509 n=1 Tax=Teleopsis dalmanni TaxID=139649 RepID=UPI0018CD6259|nr:uncharacterized protein LOC119666509 [Teleopsis dalmanni]